MCVCLVSVQLPAHICLDHRLLMFALGVFFAKKKTELSQIHYSLIVFGKKNGSESQKLGFVRFQDNLPTLLRHLWRMGHLHDGSICCQDFGSFAKILTTHKTAKRSLHTENQRTILVGIAIHFFYFLIAVRFR